MKLKIFLLFTFISLKIFAQTPIYDSTKLLQPVNAYGNDNKNGRFRGSLLIPKDTIRLAVADSGAIAFKGSALWSWNGYQWSKGTGGGGGGSTTVTFYGINGSNDSTILLLSDGSRYAASLGSSSIINTTYTNLQSLISSNALKAGSLYKLTDYRTYYKLLTTNEADRDSLGDLEPLILQATSVNSLAVEAYSEIFPEDIIHYSLNDFSSLAPLGISKGKITYRRDTRNNLSTFYDFRNIVWQRCEVTPGGPFIAFYNTTGVYNFVKTFSSGNKDISLAEGSINATFGSNSYDITVGKRLGGAGTGLFTGSSVHSVLIESDCAGVVTYGAGYIGGIYIGSSSRNINIGSRSYNISIGTNCYAIDLGLQNSDVSIPPNTIRKRLEKGYSNFEISTALSAKTIDLFNVSVGALSPFLTSSANFAGIIKVTGAAVDTLDNLTALTTSLTVQDIRIQPDSGVKILIRDTSFNSTTGKNFVLGTNILLDGSRGEYAQFHKNIINGQTAQPIFFYLSYTNKISTGGGGGTIAAGAISSLPTIGFNPGTNITSNDFITNVFYQSQPPTATLTGGGTYEFTTAGSTARTLSWTAGRQAATSTLATVVVDGVSQTFTQPAQGASVSGNKNATVLHNTNTTYSNVVTTTDSKTATATTTFTYQNKIYAGFVTSNNPSDADIIAATGSSYVGGQFSATRNQSGVLTTPSSSKYFVFVAPASYGTPNIIINGLGVTFNQTTRSFTNASGGISSYIIAVSPNPTAGQIDSYIVN